MPKKQVRAALPEVKLNLHDFRILTDLLFELNNRSNAACARALDISVKVWRRWPHTPPKWPYWNFVLKYIVTEMISTMDAKRNSHTAAYKTYAQQQLSSLEEADYSAIEQQVDNMTFQIKGAEDHLRNLLVRKGMYFDEIRRAGNSGGYSPRMLFRAAKKLGIKKTTRGFGKDKRSYWRLPTVQSIMDDELDE